MGMPADDDWILYAVTDKNLVARCLGLSSGRTAGYYSPKFRYCEVVLNGSYQGIYLMLERSRWMMCAWILMKWPIRMWPVKMWPADMIKIDRPDYYLGGFRLFHQRLGNGWIMCDVGLNPESIFDATKDYIKDYIARLWKTIYSADAYDLTNGYYKYVDMNSFVDYFIINEMSRNVDAYRLSTYLYKNNDALGGKLVAGPLWDYNLAFGNADYCSAWALPISLPVRHPERHGGTMYNDPTFDNRLNCRWSELRSDVFNTDSIQNWIDEQVAILGDAVDRNYETWDILGLVCLAELLYRRHIQRRDLLPETMDQRTFELDGRQHARRSGLRHGRQRAPIAATVRLQLR